MKNITHRYDLRTMMKSKFVRNLLLKIITIISVIVILIIIIVFFSFTSEIHTNIIEERQRQLVNIEETISKRMSEASSIAYNISKDGSFFIENVDEDKYSGYELMKALSRYLVGNDFIDYLAYYRLSEEDIIYTSQGEVNIHDFYNNFLKFQDVTEEEYMNKIKNCTNVQMIPLEKGKGTKAYVTYVCGLPEMSKNPQAFVLMWISRASIESILETQLTNCFGEIAIYDTYGNQIIQLSNLEENHDFDIDIKNIPKSLKVDGEKYLCLSEISSQNGWTYVTILRQDDILSQVASKQIEFIIVLLIVTSIAVIAMLLCIVGQYRPINDLAVSFSENGEEGEQRSIDEESVLTNTLKTLKGDSDLKSQYEIAYREAEAANKAKSAFLSNMSHDIRTPMNAIVGMTDIAMKHLDDTEYVKECLENVRVSSQYLLDIINNVLDMSRIESGKLVMAEDIVELPKIIYGIITILNHSLEEKNLSFHVEIENIKNERIIGDNIRLTQVFMNILSNSVKFTPSGGSIELKIKQNPTDEDGYGNYIFTFKDNGIGMSEEFTKRVFDSFARDDKSGAQKIEGTGLGMTIAKHFVEMMGGSIECNSKQGVGTTFTIRLHIPLAENSGQYELSEQSKSIRILILDTSEREKQQEFNLFIGLGMYAECCSTIEEAVRLIRNAKMESKPYGIILVNEASSDWGGIKTLKKLQKASVDTPVRYVLATADFLNMDKKKDSSNAYDAIMKLPLFTSYVVGILNKTYENTETTETPMIDMEGRRVLLVEDNTINRQIAEAIISETKASVYEAENGREAVEAIQSHEIGYFDVVLMDVQMPLMNGYEATAFIRGMNRRDAQTIPIYAMTANTFDEDVRQVREAGMNGHLGKPYVAEELYRILKEAIELNK